MSSVPIILIDDNAKRARALQTVLVSRQGLPSQLLPRWGRAVEMLEQAPSIPLAVLGYELLVAEDASAADASMQLLMLGVPAILVYDSRNEARVRQLKGFAHYASYLAWPASDAEIERALEAALSVGSTTTPAVQREAPEPRPLERQNIPIPSLSVGNLAKVPLARLLYLLGVQRRTGALSVTHGTQSLSVALRDGWLLRSEDNPRALDALRDAFAWSSGTYTFTWDTEGETAGQHVSLLEYIYEGLTQHTAYNGVLARLAKLDATFPAYTALFLGRYKLLSSLPHTLDVARRCRGQESLSQLLQQATNQFDTFVPILAFCLHTDLVALLEQPGHAPIGITYTLHGRVTSVSSSSPPRPVLLGETHHEIAIRPTQQAILQMSLLQLTLLSELETTQTTLLDTPPYTAFGLASGCGREAVRSAFQSLKEHLPPLPELAELPNPIRLTHGQLSGALQDTYLLLMARESEDPQDPRPPVESPFAARFMALTPPIDAVVEELQPKTHPGLRTVELPTRAVQAPPRAPRRQATPPAPLQPQTPTPSELFTQGIKHLHAQRFLEARDAFREALACDADNGRYLAHEAWASYLHNPSRQANTARKLRKALRMEQGFVDATCFLGAIALQNDALEEARKLFKRVLREDPEHFGARSRLRQLKARSAELRNKHER